MSDIRRNSRIKSTAGVSIEISDFKIQGISLFVVHQRSQAGLITSIGSLVKSVLPVITIYPTSKIVLTSVVSISIAGSVAVIVSFAKLDTVMR